MLCVTNMLLHGVDVPRVYHDNSLLKDVLDYTEKDQFDVILIMLEIICRNDHARLDYRSTSWVYILVSINCGSFLI